MARRRVQPTEDEILKGLRLLNDHFGFYRDETLPDLAHACLDVWDRGGGYAIRRYHPALHHAALTEEGRSAAIASLDEFHVILAILLHHHLYRLFAQDLMAEAEYGPDFPVRLCSDMSCRRAKRRHGKIIALRAFSDYPIDDCPCLACQCTFMFDPTGLYRM